MKPIYLFLLLLSFSFSGFSQSEPDRGGYIMTITPISVYNWGNGDACGDSYFSIRARYEQSGEKDIPDGSSILNIKKRQTKTDFPVIPPVYFSVDDRISQLIFHAKRKQHEGFKCANFREGDNTLTLSSYYSCFNDLISKGDNGRDILDGDESFNGVFRIQIKPSHVRLFFQDIDLADADHGNSYYLPQSRIVTIKATTGYTRDVYQWKYRKGGGEWLSFPDHLISGDGTVIAFSGGDFLSVQEMFEKIPVEVAIQGDCIRSDNEINLQPIPSAPTYLLTDMIKAEQCSGTGDGRVYFTLSRNMADNEFLELGYRENDGSGNVNLNISYRKLPPNQYEIYGLAPGNYDFEISGYYVDAYGKQVPTDSRGEGYSFSTNIPSSPPLNFAIQETFPGICPGDNQGGIKATAWGGAGTYRLVCKNEQAELFFSDYFPSSDTLLITGLAVGKYQVWIEDANECSLEDYPENDVEIEEPSDPVTIDQVEMFRPFSGESNGSIEVQVAGGKAPYHAVWRKNDGSGELLPDSQVKSLGEGGLISLLQQVSAGDYHVEFFDDNGCRTETILILEELPPFDINLVQNKHIHCYGESTGELEIHVVSGGVPPYTYQWFRFEDPYRHKVGEGKVLSNIPSGWYQVKVTDAASNEIWTSTIYQTEEIPVDISFQSETLHCHGDQNGFLEAILSGGNGPYTYRWLTGNTSHTGLRITGLSAGNYGLEVIDAHGCRQTSYGTVSEPAPISLYPHVTHPSCTGLANGSVQLEVTGGTHPYWVDWSTGENGSFIQNLYAGNYEATVTDIHGCRSLKSNYILVDPEPLIFSVDRIQPVTAFGKYNGSASFSIQGGTPPYRINCQDNGGSVNQTQIIHTPRNSQDPVVFSGLPEGNFIVTTWDSKYDVSIPGSCISSHTFEITQPPLLEVGVEERHFITCYKGNDGQLTAHARGGVPLDSIVPYHYKWYRVEAGRKQLLQERDSILKNLPFGQYQVEVTDKNGIVSSSAVYSLQYLNQIRIAFTSSILPCSGATGWIQSEVTGGTGSYQYRWSNGGSSSSIGNVKGGKYLLEVIDGRGCQVSAETTIHSPNPISFGFEMQKPTCFGEQNGMISLNITGGTPSYTILWEDGTRESYRENLPGGEYSVQVTDAAGCHADTTFFLTEPDPVSAKVKEYLPPRAYGYSDGRLSVEISGGVPPYQMTWTDDSGAILEADWVENEGKIISSIHHISEGNYSLRVEDMNYSLVNPAGKDPCGCLYTASFYLSEPPLLEVELENTRSIRCQGTHDGEMFAHVKGGVPFSEGLPYAYQWYKDGEFFSSGDSAINHLDPGKYYVLITDANGIEIRSTDFTLLQPELLQLSLSASDLRCSRDVNGWVEVKAAGGTAPYSYRWSTGDSVPRVESIPRGRYFVLVSDSRDCQVTGNTQIIQPGGIRAEAVLTPPTCYKGSDGSIQVQVSGGEPPYRYEWDNGQKSPVRTGLRAGTYSITLTDINECSYEVLNYKLEQPDSIIIDLGRDWELCKGQTLELNATIPESAQSYAWFDSSGNKIASGSAVSLKDAGVYRAEVLTKKGCKGAGKITITKDEKPIAADFVVASQVPIHEEVLAVNISDPEPDDIEWIFPDENGSFEILDADKHSFKMVFNKYGKYKIGMRSYAGKCEKITFKTLQVMSKEDIEGYEEADEPMLKQFTVSPNPNKGDFTLALELKENAPVVLQLVNSGTGQVVEKRYLYGKKMYREHFHLSEAGKGTFVLTMYSPKARSVEKVVVY